MQICRQDTLEEAETLQTAVCASMHTYHEANDCNADWAKQTTSWSEIFETKTGKFDTFVYPHHDYSGETLLDYDASDYEIEEI